LKSGSVEELYLETIARERFSKSPVEIWKGFEGMV
jgi:hypothetical protein